MLECLNLLLSLLEDPESLSLLQLKSVEVLEELLLILVAVLDESLPLLLLHSSSLNDHLFMESLPLDLLLFLPPDSLLLFSNSLFLEPDLFLFVSKVQISLLDKFLLLLDGDLVKVLSVLFLESSESLLLQLELSLLLEQLIRVPLVVLYAFVHCFHVKVGMTVAFSNDLLHILGVLPFGRLHVQASINASER